MPWHTIPVENNTAFWRYHITDIASLSIVMPGILLYDRSTALRKIQ